MFFSVLPFHHNQVHKHLKCLGMDENSLGQMHEQLVVKQLHQIGVLQLQQLTYTIVFLNAYKYNILHYVYCFNFDACKVHDRMTT